MSNYRSARTIIEDIHRNITCPIKWANISPDPGLVTELDFFWRDFAQKYAVDQESRHLRNLYSDPTNLDALYDPAVDEDDPATLEVDLRNIIGAGADDGWIHVARSEYQELLNPLAKMKMATDKEYEKHFPQGNSAVEVLRNRSKSGVSYFYPDVVPELTTIMWYGLDDNVWQRILFDKVRFHYIECGKAVGASKGKDTAFLKIDFDWSTPQFHAYPYPEEDIPANYIVSYTDWHQ